MKASNRSQEVKPMNADYFIEAIKTHVRDTSITDTIDVLKKPPGRRPRKKLLEQSEWFNSLSEHDQHMLSQVLEEAVDAALFGLFCVLDGVRTIEESEEKTAFQLYAVKAGQKTLINCEDDEDLHDKYNALTPPTD